MSTTFKTKQRTLSNQSCINVPNQINKKRLTDRVYEFYCVLSTFAFFYALTPANYSVIKNFYEKHTGHSIHIDTIKAYIKVLIEKDLLKLEQLKNKSGKFYLHLGVNISTSEHREGINTFDNAKQNFTPFYLRYYKQKGFDSKTQKVIPLIKGAMGVAQLMSSRFDFWQHRSKLNAKDLNICPRTYETKKKNLIDTGICIKMRSHKNVYQYRFNLKSRYQEETRLEIIKEKEQKIIELELKKQARAEKKFNGYTKHYFVGELGAIVKEYKISMNNLTKNLDPTLALEYAKITIKSYGERTNAKLIMDSWKKQYNSSKVFEQRHQTFKKGLEQENIAIKLDNKINGITNFGVMGMSEILGTSKNNQIRTQVTDDTIDTDSQSLSILLNGQIIPLFTNLVILPVQRKWKAIEATTEGHRQSLSKLELYIETNWEQLYRVLCLNNKARPDNLLSQDLTHALSLIKSKDDFKDLYYNVILETDTIARSNNKSLHRQMFSTLFNTLGNFEDLPSKVNEYLDRHRYLE